VDERRERHKWMKKAQADAEGVVITHPEKVLFPPEGSSEGITKGELAAYYEAIAPVMLPHIQARPVTMERYHRGIAAQGFFQKDVSKGFPEWLERVEVPKKGGTVHHPIVTDTRALLWLANQNSITPHVWTSRAPNLYQPDVCVFDLDPAVDEPEVLRAAALELRDLLDELGLTSWIKTSGSKGFHIVVSLDGKADFGEVSGFAHAVGSVLVARDPEHLTQEFSKADRGGRILVDTGRNGYSATFAAAYAVRAKAGAPVSAPCTWEEIERGEAGPRTFTLRTMAGRIAAVGDLWADMRKRRRSLRLPLERLRRLKPVGAAAGADGA
jgi:bifunctional non-homologous end joining protein LigD